MALQAAYKQFLAAPNSGMLAPDASLHYVTSTTSYHGATEIIKHLNSLRNQLKKKKENLLHVVEGQNAIAAEVDAAIEFVSSGGPYLPGLDDNFLADRTVYLPIIHMVSFDPEGRMTAIRQSWDQGSLLKQLDVIGKTGRNWPIRDSVEQLRLITSSLNAANVDAARPADPDVTRSRARTNSSNIMRDPHASLALFAPREEVDAQSTKIASPYAGGSRPPQRSFAELLGDEPEDEVASPSKGRERSMSPSKAMAPKGGANKHFQPIRLFETDEEHGTGPDTPEKGSPDRFYRPNPKKYQHFDFADGSEPQDAPKPGQTFDKVAKSKHDTNWSFDDFVTPHKALPTRSLHRAQDVRHWGNEEGEGVEETPVGRQQQIKPRRDAEAHFEFVDDGLPTNDGRPAGRPRGSAHNTGLGLYENNLYSEDGTKPGPDPRALGNITNLEDRRKDFDPHFAMTDESPAHGQGAGFASENAAKVGEDRKKAVKMMESNWSAYDESPSSQKENSRPAGGVGLGPKGASTDERGITIAGDGMGGRMGAGRAWAIGDDSDGEKEPRSKVPGKKQGAAQQASNFWDF